MNFAREECDRRAPQSLMRRLQPGSEYFISAQVVNDGTREARALVPATEMRGPSFGLGRRLMRAALANATGGSRGLRPEATAAVSAALLGHADIVARASRVAPG